MNADNQQTFTLNIDGILKSNNSSVNNINIRSSPSINSNNIIHKGNVGQEVKVLDETKPSGDSHTWYKIKFGQQLNNIGWVRDDVIQLSEAPTPQNPEDADTLVRFATDTKTVRVYGLKQRYMNVYDNRQEVTDLSGVTAAKIPKVESDEENYWISYIAVQDGKAYCVRFIPFFGTELIISNGNDGEIILRENGLRAWGIEYENKL